MKTKKSVALLLVLLLAVGAAALRQGIEPPAPVPSDLLPGAALLVLEAKDFASLLEAWDESAEKNRWSESDNFGVFARSRLYLRLREAHGEFAEAAGFSPQLATVKMVAGGESALALYDIGRLEFLYVTRLPMARAAESVLWQRRSEFEPRRAAEVPYYVRTEVESGRVVAFAAARDHLLLATREDLLVGALTILSGGGGPAVTADAWYRQAVEAAGRAGDLRLVMNLPAFTATPHFRSYWVQGNVSELRGYSAAVSDLRISPREVREERALLRPPGSEAAAGKRPKETALAEALELVPGDAGFYRVAISPTVEDTVALFRRKLLAPEPGNMKPTGLAAPRVWLTGGRVGNAADLETRIDHEPPRLVTETAALEPLKAVVAEAGVRAVLQVESSRGLPGSVDVFVEQQSVLALLAESDWVVEPVQEALLAAVSPRLTTARLGTRWAEKREGSHSYHCLNGLASLCVAARGTTLVVSNHAATLQSVLERLSSPRPAPAVDAGVYAAAFDHGRERPYFLRMMGLIDHPWIENYGGRGAEGRQPRFFSENLGSLSYTLERVRRATIVVHDYGDRVTHSLVYRLTE